MGTYLSTPVLDKHTEKGADLESSTPCRWAVVDMQGWRKSMEDAHVARTDVTLPAGSGGTTENDDDGGGDIGDAALTKAQVFAVFDGHGGAEVARFCQMNLVPVLTSQDAWKNMSNACNKLDTQALDINGVEAKSIGQALIDSFHALDRLIDDPNSRGEIEKLRMERPPPYNAGAQEQEEEQPESESTTDNNDAHLQPIQGGEDVQQRRHTAMDQNEIAGSIAQLQLVLANNEEDEEELDDTDGDNLDNVESDGIVHDDSDDEDEKVEISNTNENDDGEIAESQDYEDEEEQGTVTLSSADAVTLFQKLLHMNATDEDDSDDDDDDSELNGYTAPNSAEQSSGEVVIPTKEDLLNPPTGIVAPSASVPTKIQNGRKVSLFALLTISFQST